jgi:hypothetical protein
MGGIVEFLGQYNPFRECFSSYRPLPKKDDDSGIQRAEAWMKANPIEASTLKRYGMTSQQVNDYGRKIIQGLNVIQVDSSNEELVKNYLIKVCEKNYDIRQYLLDHFNQIKADRAIIKALGEKVACTFPLNNTE